MQLSPARLAAVAALVALAACGGSQPPPPTPGTVAGIATTPTGGIRRAFDAPEAYADEGCYTVDLFEDVVIRAAPAGTAPEAQQLLGHWGFAAWDGEVCHDLWIMELLPNGNVVMFDAHGPGFRDDATAFTRRGTWTQDGRIQVRKGNANVEYFIRDGRMHGVRTRGSEIHRIIMPRRG